MATLFVKTGEHNGDYYPLGRRITVIGRTESLPIQIIDEHVSRKHLQIRYEPTIDGYMAIDMNSRHGVLVNGIRITQAVQLQDNDYITIGNTTLFFTLRDFSEQKSAMHYFKKVGERYCPTLC